MNKLYKTALALIVCGMGYTASYAQTAMPPSVQVFQPQILLQKMIFESDVNDLMKSGDWGQSKAPREKKHWVAFSDRAGNTTYTSPSSSSTKFSELGFNDKVIIAKIENGYALVYTDPKYQGWPAYSEKAESKGWVPMNNLLLWQSCPADSKGIYQKALLAANLETEANKNLGFRYSNPETKSDPKGVITDMTFYFVMKTDPVTGLKLLSNQSRLDDVHSTKNVFYGWVDKNSFVPWNQRSCLEPNWDNKAVEAFNSPVGKQYPIYPDATMKEEPATFYQYGVKNPDDTKRSTQYRMNAYQTRFPILDQKPSSANNDIYKCTTFGTAGRSVINPGPIDDGRVAAEKKIAELTKKIENINIIFVIDGTQSMKPYFSSVKEAIHRSLNFFNPKQYTPHIGAVIYRDYADGEFVSESVPLSKPNDPRLLSFLDNAGTYGAKSSPNDRTNAEALFKGLEVATDATKMGFKKDESTLIVVVGDCGNDLNDTQSMTSDKIIDRLVKDNIQLISFQVLRRPDLAWNLFNDQMCEIINSSLTRQYKELNKGVRPKFKSIPTGYDFSSGTDLDFYIGSIRFAENEGEPLAPARLTKLIEDNVDIFAQSIQKQIDALINAINNPGAIAAESGFVGGDQTSLGVQEGFLIKRLGKDLYNQLKKSGASVTFTGYAPKHDAQGRDYWKPVAFMSAEELEVLLNRLSKVNDNANTNGDRKPYIDAVKALIRVMVPDISEQEMNEMGIDEVMRLASGLNESSDAVKGRSLTDIQDARIVKADEYNALVNDFADKYKVLLGIKKNPNYKYAYTTANGLKYYWIPVEDLP